MKILNFGSLNIDHVYEVPHFVQPGETLSSTKHNCFPGGKGLNQSIAMARAGAYVYHAGKIGADSGMLVHVLRESGVNTTFLDTSGQVTGHAIIQVNPTGENCILLYGGSNLEITTDYIDEVFSNLTGDYILILQNEINHLQYLLDKAGGRGISIGLNPSPISESLKNMDLSAVTWLICNEIEGTQISGCKKPTEITAKLLERYPDMKIVLTLGEQGSIYRDKYIQYVQPAFPAHVKDTTAAGDTFTGYFISGIAQGGELTDALRAASKAAAIAVSREGASSSIPYMDEVAKGLCES